MGWFSKPKKPSYPDQPTFNLGAYKQAIGQKEEYEKGVISQLEPFMLENVRNQARSAQTASDRSLTKRNLLSSGLALRNMRELQEGRQAATEDVRTSLGQDLQSAMQEAQQRKTDASKYQTGLMEAYNTQYALTKAARKRASASRRLGITKAVLGLLDIRELSNMLATRGKTGSVKPGSLVPRYEKRADYWEESLNPMAQQYWGNDYWQKYIK